MMAEKQNSKPIFASTINQAHFKPPVTSVNILLAKASHRVELEGQRNIQQIGDERHGHGGVWWGDESRPIRRLHTFFVKHKSISLSVTLLVICLSSQIQRASQCSPSSVARLLN